LPVKEEEGMMLVTRDGIRLFYYVQGQGEPLILIRGYASAASMWYSQVPQLSETFKVITFDNRDTGNSDRVEVPYSIKDMAEDTIVLIEHLALGPVHLLGISMGGMIAQQVILNRPDLVKTLILGCTTCNSGQGLSSDPEVLELFATLPELSDEENVRRSLPVFFAPETLTNRPDFIDEYVQKSLAQRPPLTTFTRHKQAIQGFSACPELQRISCPTLILHGGEDRLIPPTNAWEIHEKVPFSTIKIYEGLGHLFFMEGADAFNTDVRDYILNRHAPPGA
jgi:pimeloyl-ACP methyl ester carboxylesterase